MGLFKSREERKEQFEAKIQAKRDQYLEENQIKDIYKGENKVPINAIIDMSQNKGVIPQFQNDGIKTIYGEQLVLERQNWMIIRQNDRIIHLLEKIADDKKRKEIK